MARLGFLFAALALCGAGCQIPQRITCEGINFWVDTQRMFFGIDYPGLLSGQRESDRQAFYGLPAPGWQSPCYD